MFIVTKNKHQLNSIYLQYTVLTSDHLQELGSSAGQHTSRNNVDHADVLHGTLVCFCSQVWDGYSLLNTKSGMFADKSS